MLEFKSFCQFQRGLITSLLSQSYQDYFADDPKCESPWRRSWEEYDQAVFQHLDTVGACGFVTCLNDKVIGFASWDPRQFPDYGIIGHNCILPAFRGNAYGKRQIIEILKIFKRRGFKKARVTTGEHPFFVPAQRMYQSCGFREVSRGFGDPHSRFRTIDYQLSLMDKATRQ